MQNEESGKQRRRRELRAAVFYSAFIILHSAFAESFDHVDVQHLPPPQQRFLVGGEVDVELVALDRAAAVDHFDGAGAVVAGDFEAGGGSGGGRGGGGRTSPGLGCRTA